MYWMLLLSPTYSNARLIDRSVRIVLLPDKEILTMFAANVLTYWLFAAGITGIIAFIYPYLIYPAVLKFLPKRAIYPGQAEKQTGSNCSLLFCAYNEAETLPEKIDNLRKIKELLPELTISVYSDGSEDDTDKLLDGAGNLLDVVKAEQRQGKAAGLRKLIGACDSEIIVLMDANTVVSPETFPRLLAYFEDEKIGAVTGRLSYINTDLAENGATASVGGAYWRLEEKIKELETRSGSMMGGDGALLAMRKDYYPTIPPNQSDDMTASLEVMFNGLRCVSASDVHSFERAVEKSDEEFARKRRVSCRSYTTHRTSKNRLQKLEFIDRFKWFSHRVMRWWGGVVLMVSLLLFQLAFFTIGLGFLFFAATVIGSVLVITLGRRKVPVISQVYEILRAIFATNIGMMESLLGRDYVMWKPANR